MQIPNYLLDMGDTELKLYHDQGCKGAKKKKKKLGKCPVHFYKPSMKTFIQDFWKYGMYCLHTFSVEQDDKKGVKNNKRSN